MKTAASPLSQGQVLLHPTFASPSRRRPLQLLPLMMMEMSTVSAARGLEYHHAERAQVGAVARSWCCWVVGLCWLQSDWAATCWHWPSLKRLSNLDGRASFTEQGAPQLADCSDGRARWSLQVHHYLPEGYPHHIRSCLYPPCLTVTPPTHCCTQTARSFWCTALTPHQPSPHFYRQFKAQSTPWSTLKWKASSAIPVSLSHPPTFPVPRHPVVASAEHHQMEPSGGTVPLTTWICCQNKKLYTTQVKYSLQV